MTVINASAYRQLIDEDLEWLLSQPRTLERDHIEQILRWQHLHAKKVCEDARCRERESGCYP